MYINVIVRFGCIAFANNTASVNFVVAIVSVSQHVIFNVIVRIM